MSEQAVDIRGIRKSFGLTFSLGPVSLSIPRGAICALVGRTAPAKRR